MSQLLILLCMVVWALNTVHTNSNKAGDLVAQDAKAFAAQSPAAQAATSTEPQLQPITSGAAQSPHAIAPDESSLQAPANPAVTAPQTENMKSLAQADQESASKPASAQQPEEELRVTSKTSIRSGPSDSAQLIGRAHSGATLRVKSREAGWVQFVDPVANETGWISMAHLEPTDAMENTPQQQQPKSAKSPKPAHKKMAKLKTPKPLPQKVVKLRTSKPRHIYPTYARLPADWEFVPPRRRGLFGLFLSRRF